MKLIMSYLPLNCVLGFGGPIASSYLFALWAIKADSPRLSLHTNTALCYCPLLLGLYVMRGPRVLWSCKFTRGVSTTI
jgi:hypothetical protein